MKTGAIRLWLSFLFLEEEGKVKSEESVSSSRSSMGENSRGWRDRRLDGSGAGVEQGRRTWSESWLVVTGTMATLFQERQSSPSSYYYNYYTVILASVVSLP